MKRVIITFLGLLLLIGTATPSYAKETTASLKKQISQLKSQNQKLSKEVSTLKNDKSKLSKELTELKKEVPVVYSGKIYKDGIETVSSKFVSMGDKNYVEIDSIIPLLTIYNDSQFVFNKSSNSLFLGIQPRNGLINLINLPVYSYYDEEEIDLNKWYDGKPFIVNGKKINAGIGTWINGSEPSVTYKVNGLYSKLKFKLGLDDSSSNNHADLTIYGDENIIFSDSVERLDDPKSVEVNISNIKYIRIEFSNNTVNNDRSKLILGEPVLIP